MLGYLLSYFLYYFLRFLNFCCTTPAPTAILEVLYSHRTPYILLCTYLLIQVGIFICTRTEECIYMCVLQYHVSWL